MVKDPAFSLQWLVAWVQSLAWELSQALAAAKKKKKDSLFSTLPERRGCANPRRATGGSTRVGQEAEEQGESMHFRLCCGFCGKEQVKLGRQASNW